MMIDLGDEVGLADAIEEMLEDVERRRKVSDNNRALARKRFDRSVFRRKFASLYRLHGRPSRAAMRRRAQRI